MGLFSVVALCLVGLEAGVDKLMKAAEPFDIKSAIPQKLACRPALVPHLQVREHYFRSRAWAVVQNTVSGQFVRIDAQLWTALTHLQGKQSLSDWLEEHASNFNQVTLLEATTHLQRHGLLTGMPDDGADARRSARKAFNPLMLKLPLVNPTPLLDWIVARSSFIRGQTVLSSIILLLTLAVFIVGFNTERLVADWRQVISGVQPWWQYVLLYPFLKCLHELGHAIVLRHFGGHVKQAGISFLILMPVPYVDATDVWTLGRRGERLLVSAAGILSDITVACVAMIIWYVFEPGLLTDIAFAVMLLSFASVVFFNANPLLKFDGYYLLEDWLDSPGLARRSVAYWQYLFKSYLFLAKGVLRPVVASGERRWLLPYAAASLAYRIMISIVISVFLINQFQEIGFLLAAFSIIPLFVRPLPRLITYLCKSAQLEEQRLQASGRLLLLLSAVLVPVLMLPLPSSTRAEGIVWVPEQAQIYAAEQGDIVQWHVSNGEFVSAGQLLLQLQAPALTLELKRLETEVSLLRLEYEALRSTSPDLAMSQKLEMERQQAQIDRLRRRIEKLDLIAPRDGRVAYADESLLTGQRVKQGQLLLYLVDEKQLLVRTVVDQRQLGKVQQGVSYANVRLADDIMNPLPATVVRQIPAGNNSLPSMALANVGFGGIDVQSRDGDVQTLEEVFHVELAVADNVSRASQGGLGGRAFVTLQHAPETLAKRWWRTARQLVLRHLRV